MPSFAAEWTAAGSAMVITQPVAFCFTSSSRMNVLSADDPPPTLSPVSKNATGNLAAAMACFTAAAAIGDIEYNLFPVSPKQVSEMLRLFLSKLAVSVCDNNDARPHGGHIGILISAHHRSG